MLGAKDRGSDYAPRHRDVRKVMALINSGLPAGYLASLDTYKNEVVFKESRGYGGLVITTRKVEEVVDWMEPEKVGEYVLRYEKGKSQ